jgi:pimeloyl-ACP methyl ester carboxylesterase
MDHVIASPARAGALSRTFSKLLMGTLFRPLYGWRGEDLQGFSQFALVGGDNSRLAGAVCASKVEQAKGVVILSHPFLKFGMSYFFKNNYHEWLSAAGYHVVGFNFKGFGRSTVEGVSFAEDVISLAEWARRRYPGLPVHLLGASFGAFHGIHAIATRRAAFDSALFDSVPATLTHFFGSGMIGAVMRWMSRSRWAGVTGTRDIFHSLPLPEGLPRLFLFGANDEYITKAEVARLQQLCGAASVRTYPDCGHLEIRKAVPAEYIAAVVEFFDAHGAGPHSTSYRGLDS